MDYNWQAKFRTLSLRFTVKLNVKEYHLYTVKMILEIDNDYMTQREISECVSALTKMSGKKDAFIIAVNKPLKEIDAQLISYLVLLKLERPDLQIEIQLKHNTYIQKNHAKQVANPNKSDDDGIEYKLIQYMVYAFLVTQKSVFTIRFGNKHPLQIRYDSQSETYSFPASWYVLSKSFIPFLLVAKSGIYQDLFEKSLNALVEEVFKGSLTTLLGEQQHLMNSSKLYKACTNQTKLFIQADSSTSAQQIVIKKNDTRILLINLGRMAFYRTLRDSKTLNIYFDLNYRQNGLVSPDLKAGSYQGQEAYHYYENIRSILDDLAQQSLFHQFLFSTLVGSDLIPAKLTQKPKDETAGSKEDFISKLQAIWYFTKEIIHGVKELAKNIREHASPPKGVIFCRVYKRHILESLGKEFPKGVDNFLETSILDLGTKGIKQTLIENIERQDESYKLFFKEDLDTLLEPSWLGLKTFLQPSGENALKQQTKRATAHLGLLMFSKLVGRNGGLISASTWDGLGEREFYPPDHSSHIKAGTYYQVILPINKLSAFAPYLPVLEVLQELAPVDINNLETMLGYQRQDVARIDSENNSAVTVAVLSPKHRQLITRKDELNLWHEIQQKYLKISHRKNIILAIDLDGVLTNESQLFRLLGNWEIDFPAHPVIIVNITAGIFQNLIKVNRDYFDLYNYQNLPFWNKMSLVIFYSYIDMIRDDEPKGKTDRFYFTDCLSGENYADFVNLNQKISRTNFNISTVNRNELIAKQPALATENGGSFDMKNIWKNVFYSYNNLIPFDLILTDPSGITLFEKNSITLLNNALISKKKDTDNSLEERVRSISGYKLPVSHFKIGSKLHISSFYYAKRYFQNSFYASRFAYLLSRTIIDDHGSNREKFVRDGLVLIGYGLYSELLLNLTAKFLGHYFGIEVKNELVDDGEDLAWIKGEEFPKNAYCIIIVPIASTFSTAIKIEERLIQGGHSNIVSPHYNAIYISDGELVAHQGSQEISETTDLEARFGWTEKDVKKRIVSVNVLDYNPSRETKQKYLLSLDSKWYNPLDCILCYPNVDLLTEKPLYETDKGSTTPLLILDFPKGSADHEGFRPRFKLLPKSLRYGHYQRDNSHYHYYIDPSSFFEENNTISKHPEQKDSDGQVTTWLKGLRGDLERICLRTDSVVLLASGSNSNSSFVNLVNDILFESAASIIHYNPISDHIQNFLVTYGAEIKRADKIIYVDDVLSSNSVFLRFNYFLDNIESPAGAPIKFDACILLLNLSSYHVLENLKRKISDSAGFKRIFSFADIHVPALKNPDGTFPILSERKRYLYLVENSFLDSLKVHFIRQAAKLQANNKRIGAHRHVLMLKAIHLIYKFFSSEKADLSDIPTLKRFKRALEKLPTPFETSQELSEEIILKVLTQPPLTYYEPLRTNVFKWTLSSLLSYINSVSNKLKTDSLSFEDFSILKFYIRRATLLNSSILLSKELIILFLDQYYRKGVDPLLLNSAVKDEQTKLLDQVPLTADQLISLENFSIFYAAQVKELIYQNESRSLKLERSLQPFPQGKTGRYGQLLRILSEENVVLFQRFVDYIGRSVEWKDLVIAQITKESPYPKVDDTNQGLHQLLSRPNLQNHLRFQSLAMFFEASGQEIWNNSSVEESSFLSYLWLINFLENETRLSGLSNKTEVIIKQLKKILKGKTGLQIGAFFLVKYDVQDSAYFFAYNKNRVGGDGIPEQSWRGKDNSFLYEFMTGLKAKTFNSVKTVIELKKSDAGSWEDMYSINTDTTIPNMMNDIVPDDSNRLLMLRLSERSSEYNTDRPQGIIGFYFKVEDQELTSTQLIRYLLLLRGPLSKFISKHHENNEFKDWQVANLRQKTALLTGHGSDMLISLSLTRGSEYKEIVETLLMVQRLILDNAEVEKFGFDRSQAREVFAHYYQYRSPLPITITYFEKLKLMAEQIFQFKEIENSEQVSVDIDGVENEISFKFSSKILDLIFFELILNAKKNRWISIPGLTDGHLQDAKNTIRIATGKSEEGTHVWISNSCPALNEFCIPELNRTGNVKDYDPTAGLKLIRTILDTFHLGKIYFNEEVLTPMLSNFKVDLLLYN